MDENYKLLKEKFVSDLSGTTMLEIAALSAIFPTCVLLRKWGFSRFTQVHTIQKSHQRTETTESPNSRSWDLYTDFILVAVPILTATTILADQVYLITAGSVVAAAAIHFLSRRQTEVSNGLEDHKKHMKQFELQFVSSYRFVVMLVTSLSILAVDFTIFPRRYAKAETYGTGLMDVGVGSFVVANALVSKQARGLTQGKRNGSIFRHIGPLLVLGFARLYFTKGVNYQLHVSEYGVHWNFFFTLAAVALLTNLVRIPARYSGILGIFVLLAYQLLLQHGLSNYLISSERGNSLIDQNKEGIFSLLGYWGLYLVSVQLGYYFFNSGKFIKGNSKKSISFWDAARIWMLAGFFWALTIVCDHWIEKVSRRMCNLSYVLFTLAVNLEGLGILVLSELIPGTKQLLLEQVFTENMLAAFLLANVLTGLVNLSVDTIFAPAGFAYAILLLYLTVLTISLDVLKRLNFKIKL